MQENIKNIDILLSLESHVLQNTTFLCNVICMKWYINLVKLLHCITVKASNCPRKESLDTQIKVFGNEKVSNPYKYFILRRLTALGVCCEMYKNPRKISGYNWNQLLSYILHRYRFCGLDESSSWIILNTNFLLLTFYFRIMQTNKPNESLRSIRSTAFKFRGRFYSPISRCILSS